MLATELCLELRQSLHALHNRFEEKVIAMANIKPSSERTIALSYESIRNLTSPEEKQNGARSYFANLPARELLKLDTEANLRGYVPEHPGKRRTQVHKAIAQTLCDNPERFIQLSGGATVSAIDIDIDDSKKIVRVKRGSIINGAQTQGEIRRFFDAFDENKEEDEPNFHVRVEFIVEPDPEFIVATAIARNTSTNVQRISMAGKKNYFDELNASFQVEYPDQKLSMSETDIGDEFVDTMKLLQILWAMMPENLLPAGKRSVAEARLKSYKNRAYCLVDFENDVINKDTDENAAARYRYFVDMAGPAWREYLKWRHHKNWHGQYLRESSRQVVRDDDALTVSDGMIFPILAAVSNFVEKRGRKWAIHVPTFFDEAEMISAARDQLTAHGGSPMLMGRDASAYDTLSLLPKMVLRVAERMKLLDK